ncbi:hypothetical protein AZE42_06922 [Rhizopogon vesiculosus]|uniref:Uncharacterized protein n=1 Tax=Rhizopogon vesiculosus TaxID=180088 RepID=A0A1J8QIF4_9AGAM|nr:hypothetical protein AZE42_06922 [Rhizopogon vesiculosus]
MREAWISEVHRILPKEQLSSFQRSDYGRPTGRLALDKERSFHELQNNNELTEVDLDDLEPPDDSDDVCAARPSDYKVVPTDVAIAFDSESGVGMEEDIADERLCDLVDDALLSRCAICMQTGNGIKGSESTDKNDIKIREH